MVKGTIPTVQRYFSEPEFYTVAERVEPNATKKCASRQNHRFLLVLTIGNGATYNIDVSEQVLQYQQCRVKEEAANQHNKSRMQQMNALL